MKTISSNDILNRLKIALAASTDKELADMLGIKKATLSNWRARNSIDFSLVFSYCEHINLNWLLLGEGNMLSHEDAEDLEIQYGHQYNRVVDTRPRIPFEAAAGSLSIAIGTVHQDDCELIPVIPTFPRYDFTIVTRGDSMLPDFHSGDELACTFVKESSFIQWGRVHVLDTVQGIVLKKIFDGKKNIICKSINKEYPDFEVPKDEIYHIAIVVGLIRHF